MMMLCGSGSARFCSVLSVFYMLSVVFVCPVRFLLDFNFCGLWHSDYFVDGKK